MALTNSVEEHSQAIAFCLLAELPVSVEEEIPEREDWSLRVRGTSEGVLAVWEADCYWAGEFTMPIDEAIRREVDRTEPGGRGPWVWSPASK